ncbi:conserved hypothetical protein [Sphaerobacter thermophilus DSM 20745]|uniref:Uncharacterized protein n=1 Tax=Sphaerobacter thermophilus (strain ATCC 49802 / DSM 20745 / KCCM 41009 / NCIMB 13125 / S 6022) TaxID=479434 RepID=D1C8W0_SPHTD|nr:conserved hypothetical protein [Sphaerobacter thermophilus DSM 20745]
MLNLAPNMYLPAQAESKLEPLGLTVSVLTESALEGLHAALSCTDNHPRNAHGFYQWAETVRALRDRLLPLGWTRRDEQGFPLVVSPSGETSLAVAKGDEGTGLQHRVPQTTSKKGPKTRKLVQRNVVQLQLFAEESVDHFDEGSLKHLGWLLLVHRDFHCQELRLELSLPEGLNADGRVSEWRERIILPAVSFDGEIGPLDLAEIPAAPEVEVPIVRRTSGGGV